MATSTKSSHSARLRRRSITTAVWRPLASRRYFTPRSVFTVVKSRAVSCVCLTASVHLRANPKSARVAAPRARFKLSQAKFAALLGISVDTLQNWEQHRRRPEGPAKVLLRVAATHPEALLSVSGPSRRRRSTRSAT